MMNALELTDRDRLKEAFAELLRALKTLRAAGLKAKLHDNNPNHSIVVMVNVI